ncbi:MAG: metal-dependent hydrolase, partial [Sphingomonadales bacterium]
MTPEVEVVRHARARRMRLAVDPRTGAVRLTLPPRASLKKGLAWAEA